MSNREKYQYTLLFLVDALALVCSCAAATLTFGVWLNAIPATFTGQSYTQFFVVLVIAFLVTFSMFKQDEDFTRRSVRTETIRAWQFNGILAAVLALLMVMTKSEVADSRFLFLGLILWNVILFQLFHAALKWYLKRPGLPRMSVLVGVLTTVERAPALIADLRKDWTKDVHGIALLDAQPDEVGGMIEGVPVRAAFEDFLAWVRRDSLDEVYFDVPYDSGQSLLPYLKELESMGLDIHFNVPLLEQLYSDEAPRAVARRRPTNLERHAGSYMVSLSSTHHDLRDMVLKRAMDIVGSIVGLVISVPIIALVAVPLKLESPGPLFFKQKRVGLNGRFFYIYKLRSMYMDAEERKKELMAKNEMNGLMFKMTDDPRITKVGKFIRKTSIDELPQFYNVLLGDMSLVGTRPPTVDEYQQYESHHKRRLSMKPGITGMWQVSGRSNIEEFEDVVRMDVEYIDNWSLTLDIKILLKTVWVVFAGRGAK